MNKQLLRLNLYSKCTRLKKLYDNARQTGKTQLMLYSCYDNTILLANDEIKIKEIKSILKQHKVNCEIITLDNIGSCDNIKNRLLQVDHFVIEELVKNVIELLECENGR